MPTKEIFVDGACSGNPGPMRIAVFSNNPKIKAVMPTLSVDGTSNIGTNNIAEYHALIYALAIAQHIEDDIIIKSDSKLVVEQVNGNWKVKDPKLIPLRKDARVLIDMRKQLFNVSTTLVFIHREHNLAGHLLE
ncbi:unnamed protein product [marine sediment metagenome]|uniref:RNase H type-1 domain-containing protein n=1 Tax=marine sediment metagenome TaxID=412755 RepID=X1EY70_9ZZZZ